ncbi:HNH endonuclease [Fagus crenata]
MRPLNNKEPRRSRSQSRSSSPIKDRTRTPTSSTPPGSRPNRVTPSTSLLDRELIVTEGDTTALFEELRVSYSDSNNPRSFPYSVKQQCWDKADKVRGRDPDRWRRDPLGNLVFRKLVGCPGCLCHDYDHILPYSKGGQSTLENCQVLQAHVNRAKGNRTGMSKADLIQKSSYCRVSGRDMDLFELSAYGNVRRGQDSGGCRIQ